MASIKKLSTYELLDMYESCIRRDHYDPCGNMSKPLFDRYELRKELTRRIDGEEKTEINWGEDE